MSADQAPRVVATEAALAELERLTAEHGPLDALPVGGLLRRQLPDVLPRRGAAAGPERPPARRGRRLRPSTSTPSSTSAGTARVRARRRARRRLGLLARGPARPSLRRLHASGRRRAARPRACSIVTKVEDYRQTLRDLAEWEPFLLEQSALPGPRANLELAAAVAEEADEEALRRWAARRPGCGAVRQHRGVSPRLRRDRARPPARGRRPLRARGPAPARQRPALARARGVAIALQRFGDVDFPALLAEMQRWAAAHSSSAALPSPPSASRGSSPIGRARDVLTLLGRVTASWRTPTSARSDAFRALRQTLGYAWSVAIVALPEEGQAAVRAPTRQPRS